MNILRIRAVGIASLLVMLSACSSPAGNGANTGSEATVSENMEVVKMPDFAMTNAAGNRVNLSDFKGKKVFVNLWATWCPPCRSEIPSIEKLYSGVNTENAVFIMLSLDQDFETAKKFATGNNMKLPVYYPAENLPALFSTDGIPATFIFDEQGHLIKQNEGMDDYDTDSYRQLLH